MDLAIVAKERSGEDLTTGGAWEGHRGTKCKR